MTIILLAGCKKDYIAAEATKEVNATNLRYLVKEDVVLDSFTKLMWQRGNGRGGWEFSKIYCDNLMLGGFDDWRMPTVTELRGLIRGCSGSATGGECRVDDRCLSLACWSDACKCPDFKGPGEKGFYWEKNIWIYNGDEFGYFWSSSPLKEYPQDNRWFVNFFKGFLNSGINTSNYNIRCVRKVKPGKNG